MELVDLNGLWPEWNGIKEKVLEWIEESIDKEGTVSCKISANATALLGLYVDIGITKDNRGNIAIQWSYAVPGVDDTVAGGVLDAGLAVSVAVTDAEDVDGLLGPSSAIGASGGYLGYACIDLISFEDMSDLNGDIDGIQAGIGIGVGIDIHLTETYTREIWKINMYEVMCQLLDANEDKGEEKGCL